MENGELRKDSSNSQFSTINSQLASACAAAVDELTASRTLIDTLENENAALKTRLETEKRTTALLTELNETRKSETEALRTALAAKNETLTAKDAVIASQGKLIETLKRKKSSPWKRIGDVLIGAAIFAILK
jgi:septal ring factor EnvC (AmiA/AmiB activator)